MIRRRILAALMMVHCSCGARATELMDSEPINFAKQIQPLLIEHCAKCHGATKAQGKLRLDTAAGLEEKLAAEPALLIAGKPEESELYQRLVLPADNPKRMPKGADPLAKEQIALITNWIKQGAVIASASAAVTPVADAKPAESSIQKPVLPEVAAAPSAAIEKLAAAGARVTPLFAGSNLLEVSFAGRSEPAGDEDIALLAEVAPQVYMLNLTRAKASDAGLAPLVGLKNLAGLHLEHAAINDEALAHLSGLGRLEYLNLFDTPITDAGLQHLRSLKRLARLYLWQTKVSYDMAMSLEKEIPGLIVNLGYDHPMVVRNRLTKELEIVKKQAEVAKAEVENLQRQLDQTKKNADASAEQVLKIEGELKALVKPTDKS